MSVWQDCELLYPRGQGVMSASNVVFFHCKFEAPRGMEFYKAEFGGAARPDALIDCQVPGPPARLAWVRGIGLPRTNQYSLVHNNKDTNGNPVVFSDDTTGHVAFTSYRQLSDQELIAYNPWNLLRAPGNGEADDWDPAYTHDGKLLFSSSRGGHLEIWSAEADGSAPRQVTNDGVDVTIPSTMLSSQPMTASVADAPSNVRSSMTPPDRTRRCT